MHPCDYTGAFFIGIGFVEGSADQFIGDQRRFPYNFIGEQTGFI